MIHISVDCQKTRREINRIRFVGRTIQRSNRFSVGKREPNRHEFGGNGGVSQSEAGTQPISSKKKEEIQ
jgi:hypothetical protein